MRRSTKRLRLAIACLWTVPLSAAGGPALLAQCTPAPAGTDTGFDEVIFSTGSGSFDQVLPFDVPVRVCAEVPAGTTRASVKYAAAPRRAGPLEVDPGSCRIDTPGVPWSPEHERVPTGTTVRWLIGPLAAQRYYVFCFELEKQVTDGEQAAFRTAARAALDRALAPVSSATLTAEQTQALCLDLGAALLAVTGTDRVVTGGTLFDCQPAQLAVFATQVSRGPLEAQRRAQLVLAGAPSDDPDFAVPSLGQRQNELQAMLAAVQADPALAALLDALGRQAALEPAVAAQLQSLCAGCPALVGAAATSPARLAQGEDATQASAAPLTVGSDPAQAAAMAQGYLATAQSLADLARLVPWALGSSAPAAIGAALGDAQRAALAALARDGGPLALASGRAATLASLMKSLGGHLTDRSQGLAALADDLAVAAASVILADGSTLGNFTTNQKNYVSLDAGLTWAPELEEVVPYLGTNLYFRPVNRNAPLATLGNFRQTFSRRFAISFGLTASSIADGGGAATAARDDLFASQSLLLGAGLRITDAMRLGAGAILFKREDPSPVIDDMELYTSYYLSLSFDVDVVKMFSSTFGSWLGVPGGGT